MENLSGLSEKNNKEKNMNFIIYDVVFMILFTLFIIIFINQRKKNLKKQGWIYLYQTKLGLKFIDSAAKKWKAFLGPMQYVTIFVSYILMISIVFLMFYSVYIYVKYPEITQAIKAPPVVPLIPYFPDLFNLESIFPPFYFTYFLVSLIIVAVVHEGAHGVFARFNKIKIHSTGFAFLGPILGAFVEQDEKQMNKAPKLAQLSILSAGVFANIIFAAIFLFLIWSLFVVFFSPLGLNFNDYANDIVKLDSIKLDNNISLTLENLPETSENLIPIFLNSKKYFAHKEILKNSLERKAEYIKIYQDSPAFNSKLSGTLLKIDNYDIKSYDDLRSVLLSYKAGDNIVIETSKEKEIKKYNITLSSNEKGQPFIGISVSPPKASSIYTLIYNITPKIKNHATGIEYKSIFGDFGIFIFHMLWWIMMINFFVALFNMLPLGILDGGRFFMLTIAAITNNEKTGDKAFKFVGWIILALFIILMLKWFISLFSL